jgi:hypothetical protein
MMSSSSKWVVWRVARADVACCLLVSSKLVFVRTVDRPGERISVHWHGESEKATSDARALRSVLTEYSRQNSLCRDGCLKTGFGYAYPAKRTGTFPPLSIACIIQATLAVQVASAVNACCSWQVLVEKLGVPDRDTTQTIREARSADPENAPLGESKAWPCCNRLRAVSMHSCGS